MKCFFSVIIPTYNRAERLFPTLQSVFAQNFVDFEVILVDDGSTDNTSEIIKNKFIDEKKLYYFYKKNEERSAARNFGIEKAQGEFMIFFDSDDLMHPDYLQIVYQKIQENPQIDYFSTKFQIKNEQNISFSDINNFSEGLYDYKTLLRGNIFRLIILRKNALKAFFPIEFNLCEDWIFNILNIYGNKIYLIDNITYTLIDHTDRSMNANQKIIGARQRATDYILERIGLDVSEKKLLWANSYRFCAIHAYADHQKIQALRFWKKAFRLSGFSSEILILLIKILIGNRFLAKLKNIIN